jgi:HEAT repeat protein
MRISTMLKVAPRLAIAGFLAVAGTLTASDARSAPTQVTPTGPGFAGVYGQIPADQAEFLSTPDAIMSAAASGAPSFIWETLEHGEKVECLNCIPVVAQLLYDSNAKNREIAAWWLRRRVLGVFGPGEVYQSVLQTLATDSDPVRRSYAAYALGEFFAAPGITATAQALVSDTDARVRAASASALGRLNNDGGGALVTALGDSDPTVRLAALASAGRINSFSGVGSLAALTTDADPLVRRRTIEVLDGLSSLGKDSVAAVAAAAKNDADAGVRAIACHALGSFGNSSVLPLLQNLAQKDPNQFVRDEAQIAELRL